MIDLIREMLMAPEDHQDAYEWGAVLLSHFAIGLTLTALLAGITALLGRPVGVWRAAGIISLLYALLWEGTQIALYGATWADSLTDAAAVSLGAIAAAAAWRNRGGCVALALAALTAMGVRGVRARK